MTMILSAGLKTQSDAKNPKTQELAQNDASKALNFGNVSMQVSFNDGGSEGYYKVRPKALKPSLHNPRPDWVINDNWLVRHVGIDMEDIFESEDQTDCLVKIVETEVDGKVVETIHFPEFSELRHSPDPVQKKEYDFLVNLAKSIQEAGQIQPIEIESDLKSNTLVVLEGHLRRLACILGRIPYIKAIRNEGLHGLSTREKIGRQIIENSLRTNLTAFGNYQLAIDEVKENPKITIRELRNRLKIKTELATVLIKLINTPDKYHAQVFAMLKEGRLSANSLIKVCSYTKLTLQEDFLGKILKKSPAENSAPFLNPVARGKDGRKKSVATLQIKTHAHCVIAGNRLLELLPQLKDFSSIDSVRSVDDMNHVLKSLEQLLLTQI